MKTNKFHLRLAAALALGFVALPLQAQWLQNSDPGPYDYTDTNNWAGGVINNVFTNPPANDLNVTFSTDFILTNGVILGWAGASNVTFRSDSATPRTLHISLGNFIKTNSTGGVVTIGTAANPLILDLYGSTRQLGGSGQLGTADGTNDIYAQIIDSSGGTNGVNLSGSRIFTFLRNDSNTFVGPVRFTALRGGGFTSIKNIGAGPSALGAPTDSTNGIISAVDNTSFGYVAYLGTGDTSDRPFEWNLTGPQYSFENRGSGKLTLTGRWTLPNRTNTFTINANSNHIELAGYLKGVGLTNKLVFKGGANTNRIILSGLTNDFMAMEFTNVVLAFNNIADAGLPCALGTNGTIVHQGNAGTSSSANRSGQGATLQYFGTNATFSRTIQLSGTGYNWGIDNATNSTLTFTSDFVGASTGGGLLQRFIHLGVLNTGAMEIRGAIPDVAAGLATTLIIENSVGQNLANGGTVRLLNPTNTFTGGIQIKYARAVQVTALADTGLPSSIGTGDGFMPVGNTAITLGSTDSGRNPNTLTYVGTNDASCNRQITVLGATNNGGLAILNNSPNNSRLHFSNPGAWTLGATMNGCFATLGGTAIATNVLDTQIPNTSFSNLNLTISGSIWKLLAAHAYAGTTTVTNGTLLLEGSIGPGGDVSVWKNGVLGGNGTINNNVTVYTNGTLSPGDSLGVLTVNGNLTNNGSLRMELDKAASTNDQVTGIGTLVYGGKLIVPNLAGTLTTTDSFKLFNATAYQGAFDSIEPATPGSGLAWDLSTLTTDGTLRIQTGAVPQPRITTVGSDGTNLIFSGTNGVSGNIYYVLASTNVALPLTNWTRLLTNVFASGGTFSVTNAITPGVPQHYYTLQVQ